MKTSWHQNYVTATLCIATCLKCARRVRRFSTTATHERSRRFARTRQSWYRSSTCVATTSTSRRRCSALLDTLRTLLCSSSVPLLELVGSTDCVIYTHTHTHPFNGPFSGTTRVSRHQKGKTNLDFTVARDSECQWHQLGHMQVCTSLQTDNHASTSPLSFLQARCRSCRPTNSVKALKGDIYTVGQK